MDRKHTGFDLAPLGTPLAPAVRGQHPQDTGRAGWWHTLGITVLGSWWQEDQELQVSVGDIVSSRTA